MSFQANGNIHVHIKELAEGHKEFRRGKKMSGFGKMYLHALTKAGVEYDIFASQTGRNCSSSSSSGSKRYFISVHFSVYEKTREVIDGLDKGRYKAAMEGERFSKKIYFDRLELEAKRLPFEVGINELEVQD